MVQAPFSLHKMAMWLLFPGKDLNLYLLKKKKCAGQQYYAADFKMLCYTPHLLTSTHFLIILNALPSHLSYPIQDFYSRQQILPCPILESNIYIKTNPHPLLHYRKGHLAQLHLHLLLMYFLHPYPFSSSSSVYFSLYFS
jgi:hypothetical protein